jgi:serine/threonine protein kinase
MIWSTGKTLKNGLYTIAEGGPLKKSRLSTTYLATSVKGHQVVIKVTNDQAIDPVDFAKLRARFNDEAFKLVRCQSPYIVKVEDAFEEDGLVCIPMEFVSGMTLDRRNPLKMPEAEALRYIRQIGEALQVMEQQKFVHRDITPQNIMLRSNEGVNEAVLIDFGLVRDLDIKVSTLLASDVTAFTAPELSDSGERRGHFTDLYALGAVLYALVTGENPPKSTKRKANEKLQFPVGVNPKIAEAIEAAMQLESVDRPKVTEWLKMLPEIPLTIVKGTIAQAVERPEEKRKRQLENHQLLGLGLGTFASMVAALVSIIGVWLAYMTYFYPKEPPVPAQSPTSSQLAKPK